jgi:uncharacterized protein YjbJ (UPF0337 family)
MDRNRVKGAAKQVKGSVKEAIGKVTGDEETEAEGVVEKIIGEAQDKLGRAKDALRRPSTK